MDAVSSVLKILEAACSGKFVATFDYSLAFNFTNPAMVVEILRWLGMLEGTSVLLIPLCDLREAIPNTDILLYVDDRSWASQSAQDCVKFR